jgi:hypothetical protein
MKKVVRLTESDLEILVKKIVKESSIDEISVQPSYKRSDLSPATAINKKGEKKLVIIDSDNIVVAVGPSIDFLKNKNKEDICRIVDKLISDVFNLVEVNLKEEDISDFKNVEKLGFTCRISESIKNKKVIKENGESSRYMFFSNLEQMKRQCELLLDLDENQVEGVLENGHDWAQDHIAEAKNNMDQVFDFLMNKTKSGHMLKSVGVDEYNMPYNGEDDTNDIYPTGTSDWKK